LQRWSLTVTDSVDLPSEDRIDLSALDASRDDRRADALVQNVMNRITPTASVVDLYGFAGFQRAMATAAAVLLVVAGALVLATSRPPPNDLADLMAGWMQASHVPSNGELLSAYMGYRP
jgi:hypothetical protein